jgi:hypothetical protein
MPDEISLQKYVESLLAAKKEFDDERNIRYEEMFKSMKESTAAAFAASQKAIDIASAASDKRQDQNNEIRGAMLDVQAKMMPRLECEAGLSRNAADIKSVTDRMNTAQGRGAGIKDSWGWLVGLGGGILAFLGLALAAFEALKK